LIGVLIIKILITGATGFVGRHLISHLHQAGEGKYQLFALARNEIKFNSLNLPATIIVADLAGGGDDRWINQLPEELDVVIHCAALVHSFDTHRFYQVNRDGSAMLLQMLAARYAKLKFILLSSQAAAGPADGLEESISEVDDPRPVSHYGRSKLASEQLLAKLAPNGWQWAVLRPPMVLGPDDPAIMDLVKMVQGRFILVPGLRGGLKKRYSFVSVFDLVSMVEQTVNYLESDQQTGRVFFVAHPQTIAFSELIQAMEQELGVKWSLKLPLPIPLLHLVAWILYLMHHLFGVDFRLTPDKISELIPANWRCSSKRSVVELKGSYHWDLARSVASITDKRVKKN
jgi:nucleoside-diphosphate-sugar epimerase